MKNPSSGLCSFVVIDDLKKIEVEGMCHYIRVKIEYQNNSVEAYEVETCAFLHFKEYVFTGVSEGGFSLSRINFTGIR